MEKAKEKMICDKADKSHICKNCTQAKPHYCSDLDLCSEPDCYSKAIPAKCIPVIT